MCDTYDNYDCSDDSLSVTWIVVIVIAVIIKILFWSFVCYRWRRRYTYRTNTVVVVQPHHTVTRPGVNRAIVRGIPVAATHTAAPHYPANTTTPPAYSAEASKKYPSAPSAPMAEPPTYSEAADTEPLLR